MGLYVMNVLWKCAVHHGNSLAIRGYLNKNELTSNTVENSFPQSYQPHFKCLVIIRGLRLPYWTTQVKTSTIGRVLSNSTILEGLKCPREDVFLNQKGPILLISFVFSLKLNLEKEANNLYSQVFLGKT